MKLMLGEIAEFRSRHQPKVEPSEDLAAVRRAALTSLTDLDTNTIFIRKRYESYHHCTQIVLKPPFTTVEQLRAEMWSAVDREESFEHAVRLSEQSQLAYDQFFRYHMTLGPETREEAVSMGLDLMRRYPRDVCLACVLVQNFSMLRAFRALTDLRKLIPRSTFDAVPNLGPVIRSLGILAPFLR